MNCLRDGRASCRLKVTEQDQVIPISKTIDGILLWHKLKKIGIKGDYLDTLQALYKDSTTDIFKLLFGFKEHEAY